MSITSAGCSGQLSHLLAPELCGGQKGGSPEEPQTHSHYTIPRERVGVAVMSDPPLSASLEPLDFGKQQYTALQKHSFLGGQDPQPCFSLLNVPSFLALVVTAWVPQKQLEHAPAPGEPGPQCSVSQCLSTCSVVTRF